MRIKRLVFTPQQAAVLLALKDISISLSDIAALTHLQLSEVTKIVRTLEEGKFLRVMTIGYGGYSENLVKLTRLGKEAQETLMGKSFSVFVAETDEIPDSEQDIDRILTSTINVLKREGK